MLNAPPPPGPLPPSTAMLDIFFHKMPMAIAVLDANYELRRCNPTWTTYIARHTAIPIHPGLPFFDMLPHTQATFEPYFQRALAGEMLQIDALSLISNDAIFYWDCAIAPWMDPTGHTGLLLVVADVTERVQSRQLLEMRVRDRTRKLSALYDVMAVAAELLDIRAVLQQSLARVLVAVHANAGAIHVMDDSRTALALVAEHGLEQAAAEQLAKIGAANPAAAWLQAHGEPPPPPAGDWRQESFVHRTSMRTYMASPMYARGSVIGLLCVLRETKRPFSQEDMALLDSVSDQIAVLIENARLRHENERLLVLEERNRLARELHDAITQSLYSLTLFAETANRLLYSGELDLARDNMGHLRDTAQQALKEMRLLVHNLRPSILEKVGLDKALRQRLDAVEKRAGLQTTLSLEGVLAMPPSAEEALYHIVQEALNNSLKHSAASAVTVALTQIGSQLTLTVADNGHGFTLESLEDRGGLGLTSIQERVQRLQGEVNITSAPGRGTTIHVTLDLDKIGAAQQSADVLGWLAHPSSNL